MKKKFKIIGFILMYIIILFGLSFYLVYKDISIIALEDYNLNETSFNKLIDEIKDKVYIDNNAKISDFNLYYSKNGKVKILSFHLYTFDKKHDDIKKYQVRYLHINDKVKIYDEENDLRYSQVKDMEDLNNVIDVLDRVEFHKYTKDLNYSDFSIDYSKNNTVDNTQDLVFGIDENFNIYRVNEKKNTENNPVIKLHCRSETIHTKTSKNATKESYERWETRYFILE